MSVASRAIAKRERELFAGIEEAARLPAGVKIGLVGLTFSEEMTFDEWEDVGRKLGHVHRWSSWALGDWINWGDAIFGDDAAQATEATTIDRYDVAERVTGLAPGTLYNIASVCSRIALKRRRVELPFGTHEPVAALDPDEQVEWLQKAVDEGWTQRELREAIRGTGSSSNGGGSLTLLPGISIEERIVEAARLVYHQAQRNIDGSAVVPAEVFAQLAAALGEGE